MHSESSGSDRVPSEAVTMGWRAFAVIVLVAVGGWLLFDTPAIQSAATPRSAWRSSRTGWIARSERLSCASVAALFHTHSRDHGIGCLRCNDLEAAGLLERKDDPDSTEEHPHWTYELTAKADGTSDTAEDDAVTGTKGPRFCFGRCPSSTTLRLPSRRCTHSAT